MTYYETAQAPNGVNYFKQADKFPNGFTSWAETHFEIVRFISQCDDSDTGLVGLIATMQGTGGLYELAEEWADEFEQLNSNKDWDGEFFDEIEQFCKRKNNPNKQ